MFVKRSRKSSVKSTNYKAGLVLPVLPVNSLLGTKKHQFYLQKLRQLSEMPESHFPHYYETFINNMSEFVQVMPVEAEGPLSGMLNRGLLRGINTLNIFIKNHGKSSPLERYAMYTAAVLQDIHHLMTRYRVFITDKKGAAKKVWQPFQGPLTRDQSAEYYKLFPLGTVYQWVAGSINVLFARQLLPEDGYLWIANDMRVLADWIDALEERETESGRRFKYTLKLHRRQTGLIKTLPEINVPMVESEDFEYVLIFYHWLLRAIANGEIAINTVDSGIHVTEEGIYIESPTKERAGVFKDFREQFEELPVNNVTLFRQLGNLFGSPKKGGYDFLHQQLFSEISHTLREGYMIETGLLAHDKQLPSSPLIEPVHHFHREQHALPPLPQSNSSHQFRPTHSRR